MSGVLTDTDARPQATARGIGNQPLALWECLSGALIFFFVPLYRAGDPLLAYHAKASVAVDLLVVGGAAIAIAFLFWIIGQLARRQAALAALLPLAWFASGYTDSGARRIIGFALLAVCIFAACKWPQRVRALASDAFAVLLFPAGWLLLRALWFALVVYPPAAFADVAPVHLALTATPAHRVVWIVFDELSERAAEESLAVGAMPNWNALLEESIAAQDAHSPAHNTLLSLPSLTTGVRVVGATPHGPRDLAIRLASGQTVSWSGADTIFSWARGRGFATSIVGWYHPYGRLFGGDVVRSVWAPLPLQFGIRVGAAEIASVLRADLSYVPLARRTGLLHLRRLEWENHSTILQTLWPAAIDEAANTSRALVFLHLSIPHPPGIWDPAAQKFDTAHPHSYAENLPLVDLFLGRMRQQMEKTGAWRNTVLLITSDHTWRKSEWRNDPAWTAADALTQVDDRVPFVVHFPGAAGVRIAGPIENLVSRQLAQNILTGRVRSTAEAREWLVSEGSGR